MSACPIMSASFAGRYFSIHGWNDVLTHLTGFVPRDLLSCLRRRSAKTHLSGFHSVQESMALDSAVNAYAIIGLSFLFAGFVRLEDILIFTCLALPLFAWFNQLSAAY
jgi:hypothetical protein